MNGLEQLKFDLKELQYQLVRKSGIKDLTVHIELQILWPLTHHRGGEVTTAIRVHCDCWKLCVYLPFEEWLAGRDYYENEELEARLLDLIHQQEEEEIKYAKKT